MDSSTASSNMSKGRSMNHKYNLRSLKSNRESSKMDPNLPQDCYFDNIPDELLLMVFSYFSHIELAKNCAPVCRRWYKVSKSDCLWRKLTFHKHESSTVMKGILSCAKNPISIEADERTGKDILSCKSILLKRAEGLEHISITECNASGVHRKFTDFVVCLISKAQKLRILSLERTVFVHLSEVCNVLSSLPNLTALNLKYAGDASPDVLAELSKLLHLNSLRLASITPLTYPCTGCGNSLFVQVLSSLQSSQLMHLEIDISAIDDESLGQFSRLQQLRSLQLLSATHLGTLGLEAIGNLQNLKSLYIADGKLEATILANVFQTGKLQNLTSFGMDYCKIKFGSTSQVELFSAIAKCSCSLRNLCLAWNHWLTTEGLTAMFNSCSTLRLLDIYGSRFKKPWDSVRMYSILKDLNDLIIHKNLSARDMQTLSMLKDTIRSLRITYCDFNNWRRSPHKVFFKH